MNEVKYNITKRIYPPPLFTNGLVKSGGGCKNAGSQSL